MFYTLIAIGLIIIVALAVLLFLRWRRRKNAGPISIVMLRSSPRNFTEADLRSAFRRVHKHDPQIQKLPFDQQTDGYLVIDPELPPLAIIDSRRKYAEQDELEAPASNYDHPTLRKALVEHTSWVSIDAMGINRAVSKEMRKQVYSLLAPIAAELFDDRCMLLYLPADDRVAEPHAQVEQLLRESKVGELFSDDELHSPFIHVDKHDPQIAAAMNEARTRLPEFCSAWDRLGAESEALFKARFKTGDSEEESAEYIWLKVESLAAAGFTGVVINHAVDPAVPTKDSTTTVKLDDIVDWAYIDEKKEPHGMFVDRILMSRQR